MQSLSYASGKLSKKLYGKRLRGWGQKLNCKPINHRIKTRSIIRHCCSP